MSKSSLSVIGSFNSSTSSIGEIYVGYPFLWHGSYPLTGAAKVGKIGDLSNVAEGNDRFVGIRPIKESESMGYGYCIPCITPINFTGNIPRLNDTKKTITVSTDESHSNEREAVVSFNSLYENFMTQKSSAIYNSEGVNTGLSYYYDLVSIHDLVKKESVIDILNLYSTKYTDTINLNKYTGTGGAIKCGIEYSDKGTKIILEDVIFPIDGGDFQMTLKHATLEYTGGCLRVFPESSNITECIISHCSLSYGD